MTYPEIGKHGVNPEDVESNRPWVEGFVVREAWRPPSSWRHVESLDGYLRRYHICGIAGIDTRALTRRLRDGGSQMAVISAVDLDPERLSRRARDLPSIVGRDLVREVTPTASSIGTPETGTWRKDTSPHPNTGTGLAACPGSSRWTTESSRTSSG